MLTFKHETFIRQAIEGVLNQETDFEYELIIANDNSPDSTDDLVNEIIATHPKAYRINYYRNTENMGVMPNSNKALEMMQGQYFAACEGDDYWIDRQKLQKQVDFLDNNPECSICFHNTRIEYFEEGNSPYLLNEEIEKDVFTLDDLIGEDEIWFMATASLMIRTSAMLPLPNWLSQSKSGDIPLIILAARQGNIKYLPDVMAVYRKHAGGVSLTDHKDDEVFLRNRIFMYSKLNAETGKKYNRLFRRNIARYYFMLLKSRQFEGHYFKKLPVAFKYLELTFPDVPHGRELLRDHIFPPFIKLAYASLKKALGLWKEN